MSRYHGAMGRVMLSVSASTVAVAVTMSAWTLNRKTDRVDVTSFEDPNKVYVQGKPDIQGTVSGFFESADDRLFDAAESTDGIKMYLYQSADALSLYWYGPAWIDASIEVPASGAISVSGTFAAAGSWGRRHP